MSAGSAGSVDAPRRIAFLGLGLIGGSVARAVHGAGMSVAPRVTAWSPTGRGPSEAMAAGVIDAAARDAAAAVDGADLVVLAGPPGACLAWLDRLAGPLAAALGPDATVTDVASTKGRIVARADALGLRFVGGHPMAGLEVAGFGAATSDLFEGRPWFVVPGASAARRDVARVEWLAATCGARPTPIDAAEHDAVSASVSHLPLLVSAALVEAVAGLADDGGSDGWSRLTAVAAGGWRDMTRLARGDPAMGAGILDTNRDAVTERLHRLRVVLERWEAALAGPDAADAATLEAWLAEARRRVGGPRTGRPEER